MGEEDETGDEKEMGEEQEEGREKAGEEGIGGTGSR